MQGEDTDLVIEITPDTPETVEVPVAEKTGKVEKVETAVIEPIEDLRKQLDTMTRDREADRTARTQAETIARQSIDDAAKARDEAARAKADGVDSAMSAIQTAISAAQTEADAAEAEYRTAYDAGDGARMATAQRKMARAEARISRLDEGKADLEARQAEEPKPQARTERQPAQQRTQPDQFEQALSAATPRAQTWLRAHPEYVTDEKLNRKANAAHNMAIADGHVIDSDSYFDFCENFLGLKEEAQAKTNGGAAKPTQTTRTKSMPAAPVSREGVSMNGSLTPTQVALTPGEQRVATDGTHQWNYTDPKMGAVKGEPIGLKEFARRKLAMTKEGRYDRSFTDQ